MTTDPKNTTALDRRIARREEMSKELRAVASALEKIGIHGQLLREAATELLMGNTELVLGELATRTCPGGDGPLRPCPESAYDALAKDFEGVKFRSALSGDQAPSDGGKPGQVRRIVGGRVEYFYPPQAGESLPPVFGAGGGGSLKPAIDRKALGFALVPYLRDNVTMDEAADVVIEALGGKPAPPAPAVPEGYALVPVDELADALAAVEGVMQDAYNRGHQVCCGQGYGNCCGNPIVEWEPVDDAIMSGLQPAQQRLAAMLAAAQAKGVRHD